MKKEQIERLAGTCHVKEFSPGKRVFSESEKADNMYIPLKRAGQGELWKTRGPGWGHRERRNAGRVLTSLFESPFSDSHDRNKSRDGHVDSSRSERIDSTPSRHWGHYLPQFGDRPREKLLCSDHSLCEQRLGESTSLNPTYPFVSREQ